MLAGNLDRPGDEWRCGGLFAELNAVDDVLRWHLRFFGFRDYRLKADHAAGVLDANRCIAKFVFQRGDGIRPEKAPARRITK